MSNLQPADECEGGNSLPTVGDFGELILEDIERRLEAVSLHHSDRKKVVDVPLSLLAGGVLGEECFIHLSEVAEWMGWQRVEPV